MLILEKIMSAPIDIKETFIQEQAKRYLLSLNISFDLIYEKDYIEGRIEDKNISVIEHTEQKVLFSLIEKLEEK